MKTRDTRDEPRSLSADTASEPGKEAGGERPEEARNGDKTRQNGSTGHKADLQEDPRSNRRLADMFADRLFDITPWRLAHSSARGIFG